MKVSHWLYHTQMRKLPVDWSAIDTVLLDMDGTLLDLRFDNFSGRTYLAPNHTVQIGSALPVCDAHLSARTDGIG